MTCRSHPCYSLVMTKKTLLTAGAIFLSAIFLSGCTVTLGQNAPSNADINNLNVTLVGILSNGSGPGLYNLKTDVGLSELHDGAVELKGYIGNKVTVTGQYSGTTLYVDKVTVTQ